MSLLMSPEPPGLSPTNASAHVLEEVQAAELRLPVLVVMHSAVRGRGRLNDLNSSRVSSEGMSLWKKRALVAVYATHLSRSDMGLFLLAHRSGSRLPPSHVCMPQDSVPRRAASCQCRVLPRAVKSAAILALVRKHWLTVFDASCHAFLFQEWWIQTVRWVLL